ncbi:MFS transporter [Streptomyces sp. S1]|uniref:MFS transporter n=1 Tax=unclassified Streptomyces TaxID=2593676 RepID=UPI000EF768BE|nr:MFS transporter [Streptomyces sp. S1]
MSVSAPDAAVSEVSTSRFLRFWTAQTVSQVGQRFGMVALPVVAIETLHAGASEVGYLTAALTVCYLLIGLPAGAWVDRWSKRTTMIRAAVVRAVVLAGVPVLWAFDQLSLVWLYAVAVIVGVASVFFDVAYQSYVPFIVPDEGIERANARLESSAQISAVGGPAAAGLLLKAVSAPLVIAIDAVAYVVCAGFLATVKDSEPSRRQKAGEDSRLAQDILAGVRFVVGNPVLRRLLVSVGVSNFFATITMTLTPLLVLRTLGLGSTVMGVVLGVGTLGGLLAAFTLPKFRARFDAGKVMAVGLLLAGVSMAAFPMAGSLDESAFVIPVALLVLGQFGMTWGAVTFNIAQVSVRQRVCPKNMLARMTASIRFVVWGSMPAAAILAGWLGSHIGVVPCLWIGVAGGFLTALPIIGMDRLIHSATPAADSGV